MCHDVSTSMKMSPFWNIAFQKITTRAVFKIPLIPLNTGWCLLGFLYLGILNKKKQDMKGNMKGSMKGSMYKYIYIYVYIYKYIYIYQQRFCSQPPLRWLRCGQGSFHLRDGGLGHWENHGKSLINGPFSRHVWWNQRVFCKSTWSADVTSCNP